MTPNVRLTCAALALVAAAACKPAAKNGSTTHADLPQRVGDSGDATVSRKIGVYGSGGGDRLTVDLERPPAGGSANLWSCWQLPPDDFALGRAVCTSDAHKSLEITAANVEFTCKSNPEFGTVKARRLLSMEYCNSYDVFAYEFKPALELRLND